MIFTVAAHHGAGYLIVIGSGDANLADLCGAGSFGAEAARRMGYRGIVFDMLGVDTAISSAERYELGLHFTTQFQELSKVAMVIPAHQRSGIGEEVVRRAALDMAVFSTLDEATQWLVGQLQS